MGKYYYNSLIANAGYEVTAAAPLDSRTMVKDESDLGGLVGTTDYSVVNTWKKTPCFLGMIVYVENTKEMWVLINLKDGYTPLEWQKIASTSAVFNSLKISGDDL